MPVSRKHPFLLLELLVAFTVFSGAFFYWIKSSASATKKTIAISLQIEEEKIAKRGFLQLQQELLQGSFLWEDLDSYQKKEIATIDMEPLGSKKIPYEISFSTKEISLKDGAYKKVEVIFSFMKTLSKENQFTYSFLAKKES